GADRLRGILRLFENGRSRVEAPPEFVKRCAERVGQGGAVQDALERVELLERDDHRLAALALIPHALPEDANKARLLRLTGPCLTNHAVAGHAPRSVPRCRPANRHRRHLSPCHLMLAARCPRAGGWTASHIPLALGRAPRDQTTVPA